MTSLVHAEMHRRRASRPTCEQPKLASAINLLYYRGLLFNGRVAPFRGGERLGALGARPIQQIADFSPLKKLLQRLGSWVVRQASNTDIPDSPSGFRALSRDAALRLNVFDRYTYTLETVIQAGRKTIPLTWVPIQTNSALRPSRLIRSVSHYRPMGEPSGGSRFQPGKALQTD